MSKTRGGISASHESVLNARLAQILRELGLQATAENRQPGSRKQIDVDVEFDSHRVVLEAEIDNQKGALADASQRQQHADDGEVVADKIVAINYPAGLKAKNFSADTEIEWSVLPTEEFSSGSVWNLAGVLRRALPSGEDPDAIAKRLEAVLTSAVENLSLSQRTDLAANLGVDPSSASATIVRNAAKRALLVVASAAMFHARLDAYLSEMKPEIDARVGSKYQGEWPVGAGNPVVAGQAACRYSLTSPSHRVDFTASRRWCGWFGGSGGSGGRWRVSGGGGARSMVGPTVAVVGSSARGPSAAADATACRE